MKEKQRLEFPVLSDSGNQYAAKLSIAFTLQDYLKPIYQGFGIELPAVNGEESWTLPVPSRWVIDSEGVVRGREADPDYTQRPEPSATLEAVRSL